MTRTEQIAALDALLQELRGEQQITDWLESHTESQLWIAQSMTRQVHRAGQG